MTSTMTGVAPHILILNGPNLNMLGRREPGIYGTTTLDDIHKECTRLATDYGWTIDCRQSNHEGELVTWLQDALDQVDAIIINGAAYTHTSVALHDALKLHTVPIIEVHLSNPKERDKFRHHSYIEPVAALTISGHGAQSYYKALAYLSTKYFS